MVTNPFQLQLIAAASSETQPDTPDVITSFGPCQDTSLLDAGAGERDRRVVLRHARRQGCDTTVAAEREQAARGHTGQRRGRRLGEPRVAEGRTDGREPDRERAPRVDPRRLAGAREPTSHPRCGQAARRQRHSRPDRTQATRRGRPRRSDPACRRHRRAAHRGRAGGVARHARRNRVVARIQGSPEPHRGGARRDGRRSGATWQGRRSRRPAGVPRCLVGDARPLLRRGRAASPVPEGDRSLPALAALPPAEPVRARPPRVVSGPVRPLRRGLPRARRCPRPRDHAPGPRMDSRLPRRGDAAVRHG